MIFKAAADAEKIQTFLLQKELEYTNKIQLMANPPLASPNSLAESIYKPQANNNLITPYQVGKGLIAPSQATAIPVARPSKSSGMKL